MSRNYYPSGKIPATMTYIACFPLGWLQFQFLSKVKLQKSSDVTAVPAMRHCELQYTKRAVCLFIGCFFMREKLGDLFSREHNHGVLSSLITWIWAYYSGWKWNSTFLRLVQFLSWVWRYKPRCQSSVKPVHELLRLRDVFVITNLKRSILFHFITSDFFLSLHPSIRSILNFLPGWLYMAVAVWHLGWHFGYSTQFSPRRSRWKVIEPRSPRMV